MRPTTSRACETVVSQGSVSSMSRPAQVAPAPHRFTREEYHRTGFVNWVKDTLSAFGRTRWQRFFHLIR